MLKKMKNNKKGFTLVDEKYGTIDLGDSTAIAIGTDVTEAEILKLAELTGKGTIDTTTKDATVVTGGKVEKLTYTNTKAKKKCVYDASKAGTSGAYTVTDVK